MVGGFYNSRSPAIGIVVLLIAVGFIGASPAEGQVPEEPITVKTMSSDEVEATLAIDPESNEYHVTWQIKSQETVNTINGRALADGGEVDTTDGVLTPGGVTRPVIPVVFRDSARIGS